MALVVKDRVKETTTTTSTGTYTLAGAATGFQSFSVIGNGNQTYYTVTNGTDWEVGIGTYTSSGTTLSRDVILESSNSGNAVNWGAGTKDVFVTYPAERAVYGNDDGNVEIVGLIEKKVVISAADIDLTLGNYFTKTVTANITFTVSNIAASSLVSAFVLELTDGGSYNVTWFSGVTWPQGYPPNLTAVGVDVLGFFSFDAGTTWRGFVLGNNMA
jgi:hypothetical protein